MLWLNLDLDPAGLQNLQCETFKVATGPDPGSSPHRSSLRVSVWPNGEAGAAGRLASQRTWVGPPKRKWTEVSSILWDTTYNSSCGAQSVGPCAAKIGLLDAEMTCEDWNDLSRDLGAVPGEAKATHSGIAAYFALGEHPKPATHGQLKTGH